MRSRLPEGRGETVLVSAVALMLSVAGGCGSQYPAEFTGTGGRVGGATGGVSGAAAQGDLPCDVAQLLDAQCTSCHGDPVSGGAPMALVTRADLLASSPLGGTMLSRAITRMQATSAPMPPVPAPHASAVDIATLQAWSQAGTPAGSCGTVSDGGTTAPPVPVCVSGSTWKGGNDGNDNMNPGMACISCHAAEREAPRFTVAGTVFEAQYEPDLCNSPSAASAKVIITDGNGLDLPALTPSSSGNFSFRGTVKLPYTARVVRNGQERRMNTSQTSGDCNGCHTATGANGAPGRIFLP